MWQAGGVYVLRGSGLACMSGPTDRRSKLRGFGATGRGGLNRGPAMAHRIGMGEPCPPMEEQRGWSPGQEDPSCLQWDSSRSRRTGPTGHQPLLIRGQRAVSVLSARQIKRVWDARQGGSHNIRREIETHGIEWMSVACRRQA